MLASLAQTIDVCVNVMPVLARITTRGPNDQPMPANLLDRSEVTAIRPIRISPAQVHVSRAKITVFNMPAQCLSPLVLPLLQDLPNV